MNDCTHTKYVRYTEKYENWYTGEDEIEECVREESTQEDIDLHRYKCTQCGEIGYYSGVAKNWYEKGISSNGIKGLG